MLVVIPFCKKDWHLHRKNLDLCILFDGKVDAGDGIEGAVLCWDDHTPEEGIKAIRERAKKYFKVVVEKPQKMPAEIQGWPWAPNNFFQKICFEMQRMPGNRPWFYWEADATPLRPNWLKDLADEYQKGGKPFMGHIVEGMGHFNGVAVYPANALQFAPSIGMANRHTAWDVYCYQMDLKRNMDKLVHKANHLMQHAWNINPETGAPWNAKGDPIHFSNWHDVADGPFRADFQCSFYHRCKDGSLADQIYEHHYGGNKAVPEHKPHGEVEVKEHVPAENVRFDGKCEILIVSHEKDYPWLWYSLQSIKKNLTGHLGVTVAVPTGQTAALEKFRAHGLDFKIYSYDEIEGKGMIQHEERICTADEICPRADYILNLDSDVIMTQPHTIDEYFVNNKPVYVWRTWKSLISVDEQKRPVVSDCHQWKRYVDRDLGFDTTPYTMCRHTSIYPRWFYPFFRAHVQSTVGKPFREHVLEQKSSFPQTFAEFPAMGAYGWHYWKHHWHWIDAGSGPVPKEYFKAYWSHGGIDGFEPGHKKPGQKTPRKEMEEDFGLPPLA